MPDTTAIVKVIGDLGPQSSFDRGPAGNGEVDIQTGTDRAKETELQLRNLRTHKSSFRNLDSEPHVAV